MSEVDRLSTSGLYPALPLADRQRAKDESGGGPPPKQPERPKPAIEDVTDEQNPKPPKSLIDEYA